MITVALIRGGEERGRIWAADDGTVGYDDSIKAVVESFTTPPFVGDYVLNHGPDAKHLTLADGEAFVRALPWALGISGSLAAEIVA